MRPLAPRETPHPAPLLLEGEREKSRQPGAVLYSNKRRSIVMEVFAVGEMRATFSNSHWAPGFSLSSFGGEGRGEEAMCLLRALLRRVRGGPFA